MIQTFFRFTYLINTGENIQLKLKWGFKHCLTVNGSEYWWPHQCFNFQSNSLVQCKWSKKFCNKKKIQSILFVSSTYSMSDNWAFLAFLTFFQIPISCSCMLSLEWEKIFFFSFLRFFSDPYWTFHWRSSILPRTPLT